MRGRLQQGRRELVVGWVLCAVASLVYLLTADRSASWWDCGEFITTSHTLQVGHPPGAPVYQLLAHLFSLLSFGNLSWVAPLCNALSALAGGFTVMLLFWTAVLLWPSPRRFPLGALVGALCYLFSDTVWFSAVESEVYSLAMLVAAALVWIMLRWEQRGDDRRLLLVALLLGLGLGVHLLVLLTAPALLYVFIRAGGFRRPGWGRVALFGALFFLLGLTPYAIIPIRAAAGTPINEGNPSTPQAFRQYLARDQYEKAPLYPRMWRQRDSDQRNYRDWTYDTTGIGANAVYYFSYQFGYMYCRYLMYNFAGREAVYHTASYTPHTRRFAVERHHYIALFILPALLAIYGLLSMRRRSRRQYWLVMLLFLFGGVLLNLYLNHPCYEPRERDYAYVLSFYAVSLWIAAGAQSLWECPRLKPWLSATLLALAPLTMAAGNWPDHDRSRNHATHDIAMAHIQPCRPDAILLTLGDNDTFPLWHLLHVEQLRPDISLYNINLTGVRRSLSIIRDNLGHRPIYLSQYAYARFGALFEGHLRCIGLCWEVTPDPVAIGREKAIPDLQWHITPTEHLDPISVSFLNHWNRNLPATE